MKVKGLAKLFFKRLNDGGAHGILCPMELVGYRRIRMKPFKIAVVMIALVLLISGQVWAGGARVAGRAIGGATGGVAPGNVPPRAWTNGTFVTPGYFYYPYYYVPVYPRVVSPYAYSYYLPPTIVATLPFFCALHQVGFWTRAGMLDHLAGTHKFPLETAAYMCPDGAESCLFPSY